MTQDSNTRFFNLVTRFLRVYLPNQRNRSQCTIKSYTAGLNLFRNFLLETRSIPFKKITFDLFTHATVYDYLEWLKTTRNASDATINQRFTALKSFVKYAADEDLTLMATYVDVQKVRPPRQRRKPVKWMNEESLEILFKQAPQSRIGRRNLCIMVLLFDTAARIQELLDLRLNSLNLGEGGPIITLFGKGRKTRVLPLMGKTVLHLTEYLRAFHLNPDNNDYLFYTVIHSKREQMSPDTVAYFLKNYGEMARQSSPLFPERVYPHLLRHSRAMGLYKSKVPLPLIARFLGHVDINTTDIYATADLEMMKDAMDRVSLDFTPAIKPKWEGNEDMMLKLCGLA